MTTQKLEERLIRQRFRLIDLVRSLKPGEAIEISSRELNDAVPSFWHNGACFTSADRVLENIVGSAYEFQYKINDARQSVTFERLLSPLNEPAAYVSPDRRT